VLDPGVRGCWVGGEEGGWGGVRGRVGGGVGTGQTTWLLGGAQDVCTDQTARSQEAYPLSKQIPTLYRPFKQIREILPLNESRPCL
jgi:hypothetical protein